MTMTRCAEMLMPQHSEREDTTTWTAPVKAEEEKEKNK